MLTDEQQKLYDAFYASTHRNQYLDTRTELLVGLAAAIALDCQPCMKYYLNLAKRHDIQQEEVSEVLAKVMAVSAGQKRLLTADAIAKYW